MAETQIKITHLGATEGIISLPNREALRKNEITYIPISEFDFGNKECDELAQFVDQGRVKVEIRGTVQSSSDIKSWKGRYLDPGIHAHHDAQESSLSFHDPSTGLPSSPSDGDRYISSGIGYGWQLGTIYVWNEYCNCWDDIPPKEGMTSWIENENKVYTFNGTIWSPGSGVVPPHTHVEADITDLDHNALKIQGNDVDSAAPSNGNVLIWNTSNNKWEPGAAPSPISGRIQVYSTTPVDLNVVTPISIPWDNEEFKDADFTHSNTINPENIVVNTTGTYKIFYVVNIQDTDFNSKNIGMAIFVNTSLILRTATYGYVKNTTDQYGTITFPGYEMSLNSGDIVTLRGARVGTIGTSQTVPSQSWFRIERTS